MGFYESACPMWLYDQETLAILEVNEAAVESYGYTRGEFLRRTILDIRPAEDVPKLIKNTLHPGERHESDMEHWRHQKKDGTVIEVEITSKEVMFKGRYSELVWAKPIVHQATDPRSESRAAKKAPTRT